MNCGDGRNLIFLIGQPRSGTTLLQVLLGQHPDIFTHSESWIMLKPFFALKEGKLVAPAYGARSYTWSLEDVLDKCEDGLDTYFEAVRKMVETLYSSCLKTSGKRLFLDKSPPYYLITHELARLFPQAKIIVLLRNPLAVLNSIATTWFEGKCPLILVCPVHTHSVFVGPQLIADAIKVLGNRCLVIKYEDLVTSPEAEIVRICEYIGIQFDKEMLSYEGRPGGRLGDNEVGSHSEPVATALDDWVLSFDGYANYRFAMSYLEYLGPELFLSLGYDHETIRQTLIQRWGRLSHLAKFWARATHLVGAVKSSLQRSCRGARLDFQMEFNTTWGMYFPKFPPMVPNFSRLEGLDAPHERSIVERLIPATTIVSYWQKQSNPPKETEGDAR